MRKKSAPAQLLVAVAAVAVAALLRSLADPWLQDAYPFSIFFGAIAVAAWCGGIWPGVLAAVLGHVVSSYLFLARSATYGLPGGYAVAFVLYAVSAAAIIAAINLRRTRSEIGTLRKSVDQTLAGTDIVAWEWDVGRNLMRLSRNSIHSIGVPSCAPHPVWLLRHIYPVDRAKYVAAVGEAVTSGRAFTVTFRFLRPTDRKTLWLQNHGTVITDEHGRLRILRGILTDQTATFEAQHALRRAEEQFRSSHDASLRGYSIFRALRDPSGEIADFEWEYVNPAGARLAGKRVGDLLGHTLLETFGSEPAIRELFARMADAARTGRAQEVDTRVDLGRQTGCFRNMIVSANDGVAVEAFDLTGQVELERALRDKASALEAADRRKNEFLAMLGHELRNPLAPILTSLDLMQRALEPRQRESVTAILRRQVAHMVRLIDDLLEVSRIDQGKITLHRQPVPIGELMARGIEAARPNIDARHHDLVEVAQSPHACVDVDPARIVQVIGNLLNNAAKFTPAGGRIHLCGAVFSEHAEIAVRDEGIGIAAADLERIFERFVQVKSDDTRATVGLGLGLTLVKAIVELHGGSVAAHSDGPGRGSEFVIRLPLALDEALSVSASESMPPERSRRILLVDDNVDALETLALSLRLQGHDVRTASSGYEALELANEGAPDVVLLDLGMPGLDGYETARRLKALPGWPDRTLIVALTGWGQHEDKAKAMEAGFHHHVTKPVDPAVLGSLLQNWSA